MKDKRGWRVTSAFALPGGFELWEQDDHCVDLYHGKEHVAVFSAAAVTDRVVLEACREYLEGGVTLMVGWTCPYDCADCEHIDPAEGTFVDTYYVTQKEDEPR